MQVHLLLQIKQGNAARHPVDLMGLQLCKLRLLLLVFLMNISYDFLDEILQSHHTGHAAVFVNQNGQFDFICLHLPEQGVGPAVLRHKIGRL